MTALRRAVVILTASLLAVPASVSAQARPYRALFGGASTEQPMGKDLSVSVSLAGAYDDNVLDQTAPFGTPTRLLSGSFMSLSGDLTFRWSGRRAQFDSTLGSSVRYLSTAGQAVPMGSYGTVSLSTQLTRTASLALQQSVAYTPSHLYSLLMSPAPAVGENLTPGVDQGVSDVQAYVYGTLATFTQRIGRRSSFVVNGALDRVDFSGESAHSRDFDGYGLGARFLLGLTRGAALRLGYTHRDARYDEVTRPTQHDLDLGVDYLRPLSRTRRTTLRFSGGMTLLDGPAPGRPMDIVRQYKPVASLLLTHQMGRTWQAAARYHRGAQFVDGIADPAYTDSVGLDFGGFLTRRTDVRAAVAYVQGDLVDATSSPFETYTANVRARVGLTRKMAAFAEYVLYHYEFDPSVELPGAAPPTLTRNGLRLGITLWVPLWRD